MNEIIKETKVYVGGILKTFASDGITRIRGVISFAKDEYSDREEIFFYDKDISPNSNLLKYIKSDLEKGYFEGYGVVFKYITYHNDPFGRKTKASEICLLEEIRPEILIQVIDEKQRESSGIRRYLRLKGVYKFPG